MKKRSTRKKSQKKEKEGLSHDLIANLVGGDIPANVDFQNGFVYFAPNQRFFGSYIIGESETPSGKGYMIEKTGTKVDVEDVEYLKSIRATVFCRRENRHLEVSPVGETRV